MDESEPQQNIFYHFARLFRSVLSLGKYWAIVAHQKSPAIRRRK